MLNELYEKIETVLETLDVGGEQSRQFANEITLLKDVLGYPEPVQDEWDELKRREILEPKLRHLALEAQGILIQVSKTAMGQWFDTNSRHGTNDLQFKEIDLGKLLDFMVEAGVKTND